MVVFQDQGRMLERLAMKRWIGARKKELIDD
jgi:hypothetical protein